LLAKNSALFPKVVDQLQPPLVHPPDTAISTNRNGSRDLVMSKVTLRPFAPLRDPLQIHADPFSDTTGYPFRLSFGLSL
jgi:hypothetical protein